MIVSTTKRDLVLVLVATVLLWVSMLIVRGSEPYILHSINLIFHEAGHVICMPFGEFVHFLGGTLGQLFVPAAVGVHFLRRRDYVGALFALWWLGTNFVDIGIYMSDARTRALPLLGGEHDWYYLFAVLDVLRYDGMIGGFFKMLGTVCMFVAPLMMITHVTFVQTLLRTVRK
jgi:hypothetical protein